jgi:hypothetical protein
VKVSISINVHRCFERGGFHQKFIRADLEECFARRFGADIDYAMLVKIYGAEPEGA